MSLYLEARRQTAQSMSVIKTTSAAIYHMHRVNLFTHDPTQGPMAALVRRSAKRELGVAAKNVKIPWSLADVQLVSSRYCHVLATAPQFDPVLHSL